MKTKQALTCILLMLTAFLAIQGYVPNIHASSLFCPYITTTNLTLKPTDILVANITMNVVNDTDSGFGTPNPWWALDTYTQIVTIYFATTNSTFFVLVRNILPTSSWQTFRGLQSPGQGLGEPYNGQGGFQGGGIAQLPSGTIFSPNRTLSGFIGTFNVNVHGPINTVVGPVNGTVQASGLSFWTVYYFNHNANAGISIPDQLTTNWGWLYQYQNDGTTQYWCNANGVFQDQSGDIITALNPITTTSFITVTTPPISTSTIFTTAFTTVTTVPVTMTSTTVTTTGITGISVSFSPTITSTSIVTVPSTTTTGAIIISPTFTTTTIASGTTTYTTSQPTTLTTTLTSTSTGTSTSTDTTTISTSTTSILTATSTFTISTSSTSTGVSTTYTSTFSYPTTSTYTFYQLTTSTSTSTNTASTTTSSTSTSTVQSYSTSLATTSVTETSTSVIPTYTTTTSTATSTSSNNVDWAVVGFVVLAAVILLIIAFIIRKLRKPKKPKQQQGTGLGAKTSVPPPAAPPPGAQPKPALPNTPKS